MIAAFMKKTPDEVALATAFNALKLFGLSQWQRSRSAIRPSQRRTSHRNTSYAYGWVWPRRLGGLVINTHIYTCAITGCVAHYRSVLVFVPSQQFFRPGVHRFVRVVNVKVLIMPLLPMGAHVVVNRAEWSTLGTPASWCWLHASFVPRRFSLVQHAWQRAVIACGQLFVVWKTIRRMEKTI